MFRTPYDGQRYRVVADIRGDSLTKQSMKDEVDINRIVERFRSSGMVNHLAKGQPAYLDVSEFTDYRSALEHVRAVGAFFGGLPADVRARFANDPALYLDYVTDPANAEAVEAEFGVQPVVEPVNPAPDAEGAPA